MILFLFITISLGVILLISIYNLFTAPVIKSSTIKSSEDALISVLIPARNEEINIGKCLNSLLKQDYKNLEILVLNDQSIDGTPQVVESYSQRHKNIKLLKGDELPTGWLGKNWACEQLSQKAKGDYLLFIDSDVEVKEKTISSILEELTRSEVKMISVFPTQIIKSAGEWLVVPVMNWLLLSFLPLRLVHLNHNKSFAAANGQFMFWERKTYFKIGGHQKVKNKVVEDVEFARICKSKNIKIKTILGGDLIYCRMYTGLSKAIKGFSKNFYPGFNVNPLVFLIMITFFILIFLLPYIFIFNSSSFFLPVFLILLIRTSVSIVSKQNIFVNILFHPLQMIFMVIIGIKSVIDSKTGNSEWKGRRF